VFLFLARSTPLSAPRFIRWHARASPGKFVGGELAQMWKRNLDQSFGMLQMFIIRRIPSFFEANVSVALC
jgi:hypothetical protein